MLPLTAQIALRPRRRLPWLVLLTWLAALGLSGVPLGSLAQAQATSSDGAGRNRLRDTRTLTVGGLERTYTIQMPSSAQGRDAASAKLALVIAMHGGGGSRGQFETSAQLAPVADALGMAVMYPDGTAAGRFGWLTWNAGLCCGSAVTMQVDDVAFIRAAIDDAVTAWGVDPQRVYAMGHSNGGMMAYRLACELSDRVAAVAANAAVDVTKTCTPKRPVPILHVHSRQDQNVPLAGGVGVGPSGVAYPPVLPTIEAWAKRNRCDELRSTQARATSSDGQALTSERGDERLHWPTCAGGAEVDFVLTQQGGHAWPGGRPSALTRHVTPAGINVNELMLNFFARHRLSL